MGDTVKALKAIYVALGGSEEDVAELLTIPAVLGAIATALGASGGVLPSAAEASNGDTLEVADGAWTIVTP